MRYLLDSYESSEKLCPSLTYQSIGKLKHIIPETNDDKLRILGPFL